MSHLAQRIAELSPSKLALLEKRLGRALSPAPAEPSSPAVEAASCVPSFGEERMWFLDRLYPGSPLYNLPMLLPLAGPLSVAALARALRAVVDRHAALRSTYGVRDGHPSRRVAPPGRPVAMPVVELGSLPAARREGERERAAASWTTRAFDLERGPLVRALLVRSSAVDHRLVLVVHHIVADGGSLEVIHHDLAACYDAFVGGRAPPMAAPEASYAAYADEQRRWLAGAAGNASLAAWRRMLAGAPERLDLPTDRPRDGASPIAGRTQELAFGADAAAAIERLARDGSATRFMVLLAAFAALLARHAGCDDLVVGTPVSQRDRPELEAIVGLLINTLPLRVRVDGEAGFATLLAAVRERALDAFSHRQVPFELLVAEVAPQRRSSVHPLFQVMLALHEGHAPHPQRPHAGRPTTRPVRPVATWAKFDLSLNALAAGDRLVTFWEYRRDLFHDTTIARWARELEALLVAAAAAPGAPLADLARLLPAERHQVTAEWSVRPWPGGAGAPGASGVDDRVERRVAARAAEAPDAVALEWTDGAMTYGSLARRWRALAARLVAAGAGPGERVGVALGRGAEQVVALLATLEAGAAYVPLGGLPGERRRRVEEDARPVVVLERQLDPILGPEHPPPAGAAMADADLRPANAPAYVLYTSGSTGAPKGVVVAHRGVVDLIDWLAAAGLVGRRDRVMQRTPHHFDASVWEIFATLAQGGCLLLGRGDETPGELWRRLARHRATVLQVVPPLLAALIGPAARARRDDPAERVGLERVLCGGDVLPASLVERLAERLPDVEVLNFYGPTEASVQVTGGVVRRPGRAPRRAAGATEPIGRPIVRARIHLCDRGLRPVGPGAVGELLVGGRPLALGYRGNPAATAALFVPDPFGEEAGGRLYRTGDLGRWRPDGSLEFVARADRQVKVHGVRIEPAEVEAALADHPAIERAVVGVRGATDGFDRSLIAWIVPAGEAPPVEVLRAFLAGRLPAAMVPGQFVVCASLPVLPNGKIDRAALPAPGASRPHLASDFRSPATATEEAVAAIWQSVLELERVGVDDDFFALGGHSLVAGQVVSRLRDRLGLELPVATLFEAPTVARLAAEVDRRLAGRAAPRLGLARGERDWLIANIERLSESELDGLLDRLEAAPGEAGSESGSSVEQEVIP